MARAKLPADPLLSAVVCARIHPSKWLRPDLEQRKVRERLLCWPDGVLIAAAFRVAATTPKWTASNWLAACRQVAPSARMDIPRPDEPVSGTRNTRLPHWDLLHPGRPRPLASSLLQLDHSVVTIIAGRAAIPGRLVSAPKSTGLQSHTNQLLPLAGGPPLPVRVSAAVFDRWVQLCTTWTVTTSGGPSNAARPYRGGLPGTAR